MHARAQSGHNNYLFCSALFCLSQRLMAWFQPKQNTKKNLSRTLKKPKQDTKKNQSKTLKKVFTLTPILTRLSHLDPPPPFLMN